MSYALSPGLVSSAVCCTGRQAWPRLWHGCAVSPLLGWPPLWAPSGCRGHAMVLSPRALASNKGSAVPLSWGAGNSDFIFECCGACHFKCSPLDPATATQTWHRGASGPPYLLGKQRTSLAGGGPLRDRAKGPCLNCSRRAQRLIQEETGYTMCQARGGASEMVEFLPRGGWLCLQMNHPFQSPGSRGPLASAWEGNRGPHPVPSVCPECGQQGSDL